MTKCTKDGHQVGEVQIYPAQDFEFIEGPHDDKVDCPIPGILVRIIPGSDNGNVQVWDGTPGEGKQMANLPLEQFSGAIEFNVRFNNSLHFVLDDDAKITAIHDHL